MDAEQEKMPKAEKVENAVVRRKSFKLV